tara:strand:- start:947 stop:1306 length:360 start_codon:yes stop_codon:yes gene_type:complete
MDTSKIINELKQRSEKFMNWIELNVEDENVIKSAIQFFEFEDSALKAIIKMAQMDLMAVNSVNLENTSLNALKTDYYINVSFNKEKANSKLKKGLELVLIDGYTYNGLYFEKGNIKTWG